MHTFKLLFFTCSIFLSSFVVGAAPNTGTPAIKNFPNEVSFEYQGRLLKLQITGEATRKKFFVSVYDVAHYLQEGAALPPGKNKFQAILNDERAKQLSFKWLRNIEAAKVQDGYNESFKKILSTNEYAELQNEITEFLSYFNQEVKAGDEQVLRWLPGGYIEVLIKGNKAGSFVNPSFAKALWSIWLGDNAVVDREKLFSLWKDRVNNR